MHVQCVKDVDGQYNRNILLYESLKGPLDIMDTVHKDCFGVERNHAAPVQGLVPISMYTVSDARYMLW